MQIGKAKVNFDALQIRGPAGEFSVEPKVMEVLKVLVENAGEVISRESLVDQVWGVGYGGDERLSRAVSLLRKSLGDKRGKNQLIQTIPKHGYRLRAGAVLQDINLETQPANSSADMIDEVAYDNAKQGHSKVLWTRILPAISAVLLLLAAILNYNNGRTSSAKDESPLVMVMDSAHPARIYDEEVKADGATNADILSDILADLPIRTQKELISPNWHRYEAVTQFEPDLIVIHYSGFKQEDSSGDRPQLRLLIDYFQNTDTEFLVYSRASQDWLDGNMNIILEELYETNPALKDRIDIFPLLEYGEPYWKDQRSAQGIKLKIKDILELK